MLYRSLLVASLGAASAFMAPSAAVHRSVAAPFASPAVVAARPPALVAQQQARLSKLDAVVMQEGEAAAEAPKEDKLMDTLVTGSFFALWYLFNIGYNIYNKKALNACLLYTSPSPRDRTRSRMPSSA